MRGTQKRKETVNKKQLDQANETNPSNESYFLLSVTIMFSIPNQPFTGSPDCNSRSHLVKKENVNVFLITLKELANRSEPKEKGKV